MTRVVLPEGRLLVGRFGGVDQVTRKDGSVVPGLYEVRVLQGEADWVQTLRASYFMRDQDGQETPMAASLREPIAIGEPVAVRIQTRANLSNGKAYVNDTAVRVVRLGATA